MYVFFITLVPDARASLSPLESMTRLRHWGHRQTQASWGCTTARRLLWLLPEEEEYGVWSP